MREVHFLAVENFWLNALWSLAPTVLVGLLFWQIMRAIMRSDRREREAYDEIEAEERARIAAERTADRP